MEHFERRLEVLAAQLVPDSEQLVINPTSNADLVAGDPLMAEESYAVALPEKLESEGAWDVYR